MKTHRTLLILTVFALLAILAPTALAQDGTKQGVWLSGGSWTAPCSSSRLPPSGIVGFQVDSFVPAGYSLTETYAGHSPTRGDSSYTYSHVINSNINTHITVSWLVWVDGDALYSVQMYAPNGQLVTTSEFFASCVTGEISIRNDDIYGINDPAANQRVMATVLTDTPVYPAAALVNPTSATLKAGQTWFVVGQTTAADGSVWYEVYVAGPVTGFVPAATLSLSGPVPTSGYHGTSPD